MTPTANLPRDELDLWHYEPFRRDFDENELNGVLLFAAAGYAEEPFHSRGVESGRHALQGEGEPVLEGYPRVRQRSRGELRPCPKFGTSMTGQSFRKAPGQSFRNEYARSLGLTNRPEFPERAG